jgi:hypothetical protein
MSLFHKVKGDLIGVEKLSEFISMLDEEFLKWGRTKTTKDKRK